MLLPEDLLVRVLGGMLRRRRVGEGSKCFWASRLCAHHKKCLLEQERRTLRVGGERWVEMDIPWAYGVRVVCRCASPVFFCYMMAQRVEFAWDHAPKFHYHAFHVCHGDDQPYDHSFTRYMMRANRQVEERWLYVSQDFARTLQGERQTPYFT